MSSVNLKQFVTKVITAKGSYEWKIENFFLSNKENGKELSSPLFTVDENNEFKWCLSVYPNGFREDEKGFVSFYLTVKSANVNCKVELQVSIIDKNKEKKILKNFTYHFKEVCIGYGYGLPKFIEISYLKERKETLLPDNNLTLHCDLDIGFDYETYEINTNQSKYSQIVESYKNEKQICQDLGALLEKQELTDVVFITICNKKLEAHKSILAARSPVFLAMFTNNMIEKLQSEINIVDFDVEIVSEMLEFVYTGKVKNIEKNGIDLLRIAEKYQIMGLKDMCEYFLYSSLSKENASDLLILADQCNSEDFKTKVIKFILSHKKEIISTPQFIDLKAKHPNLIADLFCIDC